MEWIGWVLVLRTAYLVRSFGNRHSSYLRSSVSGSKKSDLCRIGTGRENTFDGNDDDSMNETTRRRPLYLAQNDITCGDWVQSTACFRGDNFFWELIVVPAATHYAVDRGWQSWYSHMNSAWFLGPGEEKEAIETQHCKEHALMCRNNRNPNNKDNLDLNYLGK